VSTAVSNITVISGGFVSAVWAKYSLSFVTGGEKSKKDLANSLVTIIVCQAVIELLGIVFADPILRFLNTPAETYREAKLFLILFTAVSVFSTLSSLTNVMSNGLDSPRGILTLNILNQVMPCGLLVLMLRVFKLGLIGGAIYAGVSAAVMATIGFARLLLQKKLQLPKWREIKVDLGECSAIIRMSAVIFLQSVLCNAGYLAVEIQRNQYLSLDYISASSVTIPVANAFGIFSTIITVVVPQNYAAANYQRTKKLLFQTFWACEAYGIICCLIYWIFGKSYFTSISSDPSFISWGTFHWRWFGLGFVTIPALYVVRNFFVAVQRPGIALGAGFAELIGNALCAYLLIPYVGEIGNALSRPVGWGLATAYSFLCYFAKKNAFFPKETEPAEMTI
jgi:Na+-driven multidrug efflux pump